MSRFDSQEEGISWGMWEPIVSRALGGRRGQEALAELERALLALPEKKLVEGHLVSPDGVCAVGAYVAQRRADEHGMDMADVVGLMSVTVLCECSHRRNEHRDDGDCTGTMPWNDEPCRCTGYDPRESDIYETAEAGTAAGLTHTVAWHLAYLNDEQFYGASPEDRYEKMLAWVRRALGRDEAAHPAGL